MPTPLPAPLDRFLTTHADALDTEHTTSPALLQALAAAGQFHKGVPTALGGDGSPTGEALDAIAAVAERSLAAAFVFWGQRACIEYLLQSPNQGLRDRWLPGLLAGVVAGATGLSNAMKFLSGLEPLQIAARPAAHGWTLDGQVPWATNLRPGHFLVAAAVDRADGGGPFIAAIPHDRAGLARSGDLDLIALRGTHTAALQLHGLPLDDADVIAPDATAWLPRVRPAFLALQCGLSIGLARAGLHAADTLGSGARPVLATPIAAAREALDAAVAALHAGLADGRFVGQPVPLFHLRIQLAELALDAVQLELQASGGRAYHRDQPLGFARRWREAAFVPIVTPSLTQLRGELAKRAALGPTA